MHRSVLFFVICMSVFIHTTLAATDLAESASCGNADTCASGNVCLGNVCRNVTAADGYIPPNGLGNMCSASDCCPSGGGLVCDSQVSKCRPQVPYLTTITCTGAPQSAVNGGAGGASPAPGSTSGSTGSPSPSTGPTVPVPTAHNAATTTSSHSYFSLLALIATLAILFK